MSEFRTKVALVTGAGSGIGRATALAFAKAGARVVVSDVAVDSGKETVALVRELGGEAVFVQADVSRDRDVEALVAEAAAGCGGLDISIHNAGIGGVEARTADYPEEDWRRVLEVNLTGVWLCMKHAIPALLARGGGVIVNVASVAGLVGYPKHAAYAASKHGVVGLTRTAALEYARRGIRVNAICPGFTRTPMVEEGLIAAGGAAAEERLVRAVPMGRLGTPEEIAATILYLCSDAASFVTGQAIAVDGGVVAA